MRLSNKMERLQERQGLESLKGIQIPEKLLTGQT